MVQLGRFFMHLLVTLFFIGLVGCAVTVVLSWISIFASEFSRSKDSQAEALLEGQVSSSKIADRSVRSSKQEERGTVSTAAK